MAASYLGHALAGITVAFVVLLLAIVTALLFPRKANTEIGGNEKFIEPSSGLIALALYFALGPLQALLA